MAVVSSQKHNVTIGKKSSWEIAYLCKVNDKVVGNNFKGYPSKCKVLPGRRMIEVEHYRQWKDSSTGLMVAGAMFGAIGGAIAGAAAAAGFVVGAMAYTGWCGVGVMSNMAGFFLGGGAAPFLNNFEGLWTKCKFLCQKFINFVE